MMFSGVLPLETSWRREMWVQHFCVWNHPLLFFPWSAILTLEHEVMCGWWWRVWWSESSHIESSSRGFNYSEVNSFLSPHGDGVHHHPHHVMWLSWLLILLMMLLHVFHLGMGNFIISCSIMFDLNLLSFSLSLDSFDVRAFVWHEILMRNGGNQERRRFGCFMWCCFVMNKNLIHLRTAEDPFDSPLFSFSLTSPHQIIHSAFPFFLFIASCQKLYRRVCCFYLRDATILVILSSCRCPFCRLYDCNKS